MKLGLILLPAVALLLTAASPAPRVFTPREGSADYRSIALVHKDSERADKHIEPYKIALVRMVHTRSLSIAYVDARAIGDDLVVFEQVLVRKRGGAWRSVWVDGSGGSNQCAEGIVHYAKIIRFVRRQGVDHRALLPGFQVKLDNARSGVECAFGDFEIDAGIVN
jgi:hypothetical protein